MNALALISVLIVSGAAIAFTLVFALKGLQNHLYHNKGIDQHSLFVVCPTCGSKHKRQKKGQQCQDCYTSF